MIVYVFVYNMIFFQLVSLLPAKQHLVVVSGLLDSPLSFIKCKAMDILISRIQHVSSQELDDLVIFCAVVCISFC